MKKILFQSDYSLAKTGFARNAKAVLSYLYKTNKYEIVHYCCGMAENSVHLSRTPWRSIGCLPANQQELAEINKDPHLARMASYGARNLDKVIQDEKPDIYIGAQDIWGVDYSAGKPWFNQINSVIWTTLDSLPILPAAVNAAKKAKNYWVWSNFATKALHKMGLGHVKTIHGAVESKDFYKLTESEKLALRKSNDIDEGAFIVGFVFRNQLRKSVPNLLEGYKLWKNSNPRAKNAKLLLHTHFGEGWNIMKLAAEYGIPKEEILTTHVCKNCLRYEVKPFAGQDVKCKHCGGEKSQTTTNVGLGVSEAQLNEVYNLMDVYCHPFTSGGQEIPIQEAKFAELITLVTNYSCGEEMCEEKAHSLPLDWSEYREHGSEFRKASTFPASIAKQLNKVFEMTKTRRAEMGKKARDWAVDNFSTESVGRLIEAELDGFPKVEGEISTEERAKDPNHKVPSIESDGEWVLYLYKNILKDETIDDKNEGYKYWMTELGKGVKRQGIEDYFRQVAVKDNQKNKKADFSELFDKEDEGRRILYVMPESIGDVFLSTSLFKSIRELYPTYNIYVATKPQYFEVLDGNPYVYKAIPYNDQMKNIFWLEGIGDHKGFFEIAYLPFANTQCMITYTHNAKDKLAYDINYAAPN